MYRHMYAFDHERKWCHIFHYTWKYSLGWFVVHVDWLIDILVKC